MFASVFEVVERLGAVVSALDADAMSADDAVRMIETFSKAEKLVAAGRTIATQRALQTRAWRARGYRNPAQWLAAQAGTTVAAAVGVVQTASALQELPATREALVQGRVSVPQAAEIVVAAQADPAAEASLLEAAEKDTFKQLRERCISVAAAAAGDEGIDERVRRHRYFRYRYVGGAIEFDGRVVPADGAPLFAEIDKRAQKAFEQARHSAGRERLASYMADALVSLVSEPARKVVVNVHVDESAFDRGHTVAGERCEIPGVGPIPVSTARKLASQGKTKRLGRRDHDVTRVSHEGRDIPAKLRSAVEARDQVCVVPGCDVRVGLEIDHIIPIAEGGKTCLSNLCRACAFHHYLKTHHGWQIHGPPGQWTLIPPPPGWKPKRRFNRNE